MSERKNRICPVEKAGSLDIRIRRWIQNPEKILKPYIEPGMTVLDFGCGPGFFTIDLAQLVGDSGCVIAADLQEGMLERLTKKISGTIFEKVIQLHKSESNKIGINEKIDFALVFYVLHEIPHQENFFSEIISVLKPGGSILIVEPPFHVSKKSFNDYVHMAENVGLTPIEGPKILFSKSIMFRKI